MEDTCRPKGKCDLEYDLGQLNFPIALTGPMHAFSS